MIEIMLNYPKGIEIHRLDDLIALDKGQTVVKYGKIGVYAGLELVVTGSIACSCGEISEIPVILYPREDGLMEREEVRYLEPPAKRIHGYSIIESISEEDPRFKIYQNMLNIENLI